ncbi:MAG TPA: hypothetical protein VMT39_02860 [Candidatus Bathyarchaeia archaeon]|nr:hypothetical protein [Candidatus Bathyarchaeia archaeon]
MFGVGTSGLFHPGGVGAAAGGSPTAHRVAYGASGARTALVGANDASSGSLTGPSRGSGA